MVAEAARRYGYSRYYTDWKKLVKDPDIELFVNGAPNNLHKDPCIEAAEIGKHILCEKPLAMTAEEAKTMVEVVRKNKVKHMVGFNYRFVPAIQVAKKLIDDGTIGKIFHFHGRYLQEWIMDPNFPRVWRLVKDKAGTGAIGDLGSHVVDLAHFLVGNITSATALTRTYIKRRPLPGDQSKKGRVDVDDAFESIIEFDNGAIGHISASRFCGGRKNYQNIEIYGENGSISFNLERLNELNVHLKHQDIKDLESSFHETLISEVYHPYWKNWWPHGHIIGWEHTLIHEAHHIINAIMKDEKVDPTGATFKDGYKCNVILDAMVESANRGKKVQVNYSL